MINTLLQTAASVLDFWFSDDPLENQKKWWQKDPKFDQLIKDKFEVTLITANDGQCEQWLGEASSCLAYIVLLDQFSRNIYRGTPNAFAQDAKALAACQQGLSQGFDQQLKPIERSVFYMPLEHAEDIDCQQQCVELFNQLYADAPIELKVILKGNLDYAIRHRDVIARFGRFPHRNKILGRESTQEEIAFLATPGSSF